MIGLISPLVLPAAVALDLLAGDPPRLPHPVRLMGRAITVAQERLRNSFLPEKAAGAVMAVALVALTLLATSLMLAFAAGLGKGFRFGLETVLVYFCLSARSLDQAAGNVLQALASRGLADAREHLRWIVGRQVQQLPVQGVLRATIETVSENLVDGFTAPLLFAAVAGVPGALAYKMINTMDSMVGYKTPAYFKFGWLPAKLDDLVNWLPARLCVPVIAIAGQILAGRGGLAWQTARAEARNHSSPNSGFAEAAFAGVLGVKLGGPNYYHGQKIIKPYIGTCFGPAKLMDITRACDLMLLSAILWLPVCMLVAWAL